MSRLVSDIMTRDFEKIKPDTNLLDCARKMVKKKIGSLLVVEKKRLVGFISDRDILWALVKKSKEDLSKIKAIDISTKKIATIKPTDNLDKTIKKMKKLKFKKLPVIQNKEVVGIITLRDILTFNPQVYPDIKEITRIKEETNKLRRIKKAKNRDFMHEGTCEECGNTDILNRIDGRLICISCKDSM